jgi:hypothetical protein
MLVNNYICNGGNVINKTQFIPFLDMESRDCVYFDIL